LCSNGSKHHNINKSFVERLELVFDKFPKYCMKMLGEFSAKVGREDIFKPTIGNEFTRN
jgi:hypothetical protein